MKRNLQTFAFLIMAIFIFANLSFAQKSPVILKNSISVQEINTQKANGDYELLLPGNTGENTTWASYWFGADVGYVFGTNTYGDLAYGQHFTVTEPYTIMGGIFWIAERVGTTGTVKFSVWDMTDEGPGDVLYQETVDFADITPSINLADAFEIIFEQPVPVTSDYLIGIDISDLDAYSHSTGDPDTGQVTYGMGTVSSQEGQGGENWLAWVQFNDKTWHNTQEDGFDVDIAIFPYVMPATAEDHMVTFRVNMGPATLEGFDTAVHNVFVTGDFLGWALPGTEGSLELSMEAPSNDMEIFWDEGFEDWDSGNPGALPEGWAVYRTSSLTDNPTEMPTEALWVANNPDSNPFGGGEVPNPDAWKTYVRTGEGSMVIGYTAPEFTWAVTPEIQLPETAGNLEFWTWYVNAIDNIGPFPTNYHVAVYADGEWSIELSQIGTEDTETNNVWEEPVLVDLSDYSEKSIKIAFIYEYSDGFEMAVDDIAIYGAGMEEYDNIFFSATLEVEGGEIAYKYFSDYIDAGLDGGEWEGEPYRTAAIYANLTLNDVWGDMPTFVDKVLTESVFNLFPNPVRNMLFIENSAQINEVRIFDLTGRLLMSQVVNSNNAAVSVSEFKTGVYIMQVMTVNGVASKKFMVR